MTKEETLKFIADRLAGSADDHDSAGVSIHEGRVYIDTTDGIIGLDVVFTPND